MSVALGGCTARGLGTPASGPHSPPKAGGDAGPRSKRPCPSRRLAACGETHLSAEAGQSSRWGRGARLTRRVREEPPPGELARVYSDRNATMSGAKRRGSAGMDRQPNAAWVSPQAVSPRSSSSAVETGPPADQSAATPWTIPAPPVLRMPSGTLCLPGNAPFSEPAANKLSPLTPEYSIRARRIGDVSRKTGEIR